MNTKLATKSNSTTIDYNNVAETLSSIRASLTADGTPYGIVSDHVDPDAVQDAMHDLMRLANENIGSSLAKSILNAKCNRNITSNSNAMSILKGRCLDDLKNADYDGNVADSIALRNLADSSISYCVVDNNSVRILTASDVLELISDIAFDDDFMSHVKKQSVRDFKIIREL